LAFFFSRNFKVRLLTLIYDARQLIRFDGVFNPALLALDTFFGCTLTAADFVDAGAVRGTSVSFGMPAPDITKQVNRTRRIHILSQASDRGPLEAMRRLPVSA